MSRSAPSRVMCCTRFTVCAQGMSANTHRFVEHISVLLPWFTWRLLSAGCINRRQHPRWHADSCAFPSEKDPFSLPTLSLESTLSSKGCSTPLWERRNECSPWLPARMGMPWSAHYPMPVPSGPGPSHWARRDSGACSVLPLRCFPPCRLLLHPPLLSSTS